MPDAIRPEAIAAVGLTLCRHDHLLEPRTRIRHGCLDRGLVELRWRPKSTEDRAVRHFPRIAGWSDARQAFLQTEHVGPRCCAQAVKRLARTNLRARMLV